MTPKFRRIAVFVGAAALAGGAGIGVAAQDGSGQAGATPGMSRPSLGGQGGPGAQGAGQLSALAEDLGVSESRLRVALEATRPSGDPGSAGSGPPDPSDMASALARELGLSAAKVREALEALPARGGGPGRSGVPGPSGIAPDGGALPDGGTPPDGSSS